MLQADGRATLQEISKNIGLTSMGTKKRLEKLIKKDSILTPEEVAVKTGQPLFKVRSGLRELKNAGFVEEAEQKYKLSKTGETVIQ